ncbi:MAG: hypothetical protein PHP74_03350 [Candidatus Gracilibacteria bacterium]|nr:hypothetical protein [Candidatus Gracilibacteria bacterium]
MNKICKKCGTDFEITEEDLGFYDRISPIINGKKYPMPTPTLCPDCRLRRRLSFRNENVLHKRKCDLCQKQIISVFPEDAHFPVYCVDCFWSDKWSPLNYGRDFDFDRPFFDQFKELMEAVPKMGFYQLSTENSEYNSYSAYAKNVYMSPGSYFIEDCVYARGSQYLKDCLNGNFLDHCELVESAVNSSNCYNCRKIFNCKNCSDCSYLADSTGCKNCFMCSGLRQQKYCIKNKPYSKEEYERILHEKLSQPDESLMTEFVEFNKTIPKKYQNQQNCENSSGNFIQDCKNAQMCFDCYKVQDSKYIIGCEDVKDSMDLNMHDKNIQLCYEMSSGGDSSYMTKFCFCSCLSPYTEYGFSCFFAKDCFGCDGINSKTENCILNKRYSKQEYDILKGKIIEHMTKSGEYGEFFPMELSPVPYNESMAQKTFPMSKEAILSEGLKWKEEDKKEFFKSDYLLPYKIEETTDDVLNHILSCEVCGKNYKIVPMELSLSKKIQAPLSRKCLDCRQSDLEVFRKPGKLHERFCDSCGIDVISVYKSTDPEKILCEKCFYKSQ